MEVGKKMTAAGIVFFILLGSIAVSPVWAQKQPVQARESVFRRGWDRVSTMGKSTEERERILAERRLRREERHKEKEAQKMQRELRREKNRMEKGTGERPRIRQRQK